VGSWGEGIQWWTGCPDSMARALWKKDAGRGTLGVPMMPFWESSMNQVLGGLLFAKKRANVIWPFERGKKI